jgi:archaellum biogenesis ATPase FlaH
VQKLLISVLISNEEIFARCQNILNAKYFVNKFRPVMRFILDYANEYRALPKHVQIQAQFGVNLDVVDDINAQQQDAFLDEIEEFCKNRALADAVLGAPELIQKGNYAEVEKRVKDAILVGLSSNIGINYFAEPKERLLRIKNSNGQVSCGWTTVDKKLYGGVNRKELTIWCAGSGGGKSVTMQNMAVNMVKAGLNVIYISLELSEEMISMRLDSMVSGVNTTEIFARIDDVEIKVLMAGKKSGKFHVKQLPQGTTANDIRSYLKNYEIETGSKCDTLFVDYLDLMFPNNKKIDVSNLFIKDKFVTEELRGLAVERNMIVQTASQLGRCLTLDTTVVRNGEKIRIDQLKVGDYIENESGPVKVTEILPIIKQGVFEIKTKSDKSIKASAKHMFPTKHGLKTLESGLAVGDLLRCRLINEDWDEIESIAYIGIQDTVDINVDNDRLFWANDILTHNSATNESEMDHSHIAGGISKIQTADNVIAILCTPAMRDRGQYQFQFMKTRSSSGVGSKVIMGYNQETLRIYDLDEEGGGVVAPVKTAADMMSDLRRKNNSATTETNQDHQPAKNVATLKELTQMVRR